VLLYFHGGGFVIGDVACYDGLTRFSRAKDASPCFRSTIV
jgi:acetyl esterase/lipase